MITLTNKKINYTVENTLDSIKLNGTVNIDENNIITDFNAQFFVEDSNYIGSMYYSERGDKVSKNISDIPTDNVNTVEQLVNTTINEIKEELSK
jgi:hypothetical protein